MKVLSFISIFVAAFLFSGFKIQAAPGDLDPSFGSGGFVTTSFGGRSQNLASGAVIQPDGKIVVVGYSQQNQQYAHISVVRYGTDGSLDESFSGGKIVTVVGISSYANDVILQPDGKILVAATAQTVNGNSSFAMVRYNSNGSLDNSFGNNGIVSTAIAAERDEASSIVLQPDGKIIVVGSSNSVSGYDYAASRYNSNGTLDLSFGQNGRILIPIGENDDRAAAVALQSDGKIIITGVASIDTGSKVASVRCNPDGSLDSSFGQNGKVITAVGTVSGASDLVIQPNGKIVVSGGTITSGGDFTVVRYNADGHLDDSFGSGGVVVTPIGDYFDFASSIALQTDGKIVVGGTSSRPGDSDFAVARYNPNGSLDTSFGTMGKVNTPIGSDFSEVTVLIQPNGKIVAAGSDQNGQTNSGPIDFAVARYLSGTKQFDFDADGKSDVSVFRPANGAWYIQQSNNGFTGVAFGLGTDKLVPADYDGDGKTDIAVVRDGVWYLQRSTQGFIGIQFGDGNDIPVPADYDGDGKADIAVFRPSNGTWYLLQSTAGFTGVSFGISTDKPVPADYDGDGKTDIAVNRSGTWYINRSALGFYGVQFGDGNDKLVPADYDGDGKADVAVFRPSNGTWYLLQSTTGFTGVQFGSGTDIPVAADYDGDGKADVAVVRNGTWYIQRSSQGFTGVAFGASTDKPLPNVFVR